MTPTEHELTVAVDAAARKLWEGLARAGDVYAGRRPFDDLDELLQQRLREEVLPIVTAVLAALPDRGLEIARRVRDRMCLCGWEKTSGVNEHDNWCPASVVDEELLDDPAEAAPHRQ